MNIVLIGYRGCGKTTVGRMLADALWLKFIDVDEEIARQARRPVVEVFQLVGDEEFGRIESVVIAQIADRDGQVIGFGGRTPLTATNVQTLKVCGHGRFIWLRAEPGVLAGRLADRQSPNYSDTEKEIERILAEREPIYRSAADVTIDTTYMTPPQVIQQITRVI